MTDRLRAFADRLESPGTRPLAVAVVVLSLLLATATAFAVTQRLKLERSPVTAPRLERVIGPLCNCDRDTARLVVRLREPLLVNASIVDSAGEHVRMLATDLRRPRGDAGFTWDGRTDGGEVPPDGRYRLRLELPELERTITVPTPVRLDTRPPRLRLLELSPSVFSPDGDGRRDRVVLRYRTNQPAYPVVEVDGQQAVRGLMQPAGAARIRWGGRLDGEFVEPGEYSIRLFVVDEAGNRSAPTRAQVVRVRYVELVRSDRRARIGGRLAFTTDADARRVDYSLTPVGPGEGFGGTVEPGRAAVRIPRTLRPGRYVLRVAVGVRGDRALVELRRR